MKLPVLIAARNEADNIGRTLGSLDYHTVEPIVIDDGSSDETARIVRDNFPGVTLLQLEQWKGKMPALQTAIKYLGERATEPFATLDADTRPAFSSRWSDALLRSRATCDPNKPAVIVGSSLYIGHADVAMAAYRSISEIRLQARGRRNPDSRGWFGRNTLIHLHNQSAVDRVLELPNFWPREDVALKDATVRDGQIVVGEVYKTPDLLAMCLTSGRRLNRLTDRLGMTQKEASNAYDTKYSNDTPPGAVAYVSYDTVEDQT